MMTKLDDYKRFLDSRDTTWRVEYRPPIIYCKECRHRIGPLSECALAHYLVGPNDYCSKGETA